MTGSRNVFFTPSLVLLAALHSSPNLRHSSEVLRRSAGDRRVASTRGTHTCLQYHDRLAKLLLKLPRLLLGTLQLVGAFRDSISQKSYHCFLGLHLLAQLISLDLSARFWQ